MTTLHSIGIIGGGAWGTALAQVLRSAGRQVIIHAREKAVIESVNLYHHNNSYLPNLKLDVLIKATGSMADLALCDALFIVVPAQYMRDTCKHIIGRVPSHTPIVICSKGIENTTGALMHEVAAAVLPEHPLAILSGPTFAAEVAQGLPTAVTIAAKDITLAQRIAEACSNRTFRPYMSDDMTGVELGGALKNVFAIGCGIVVGKGLGENARAALITRGLAEMLKLALACGARPETLAGLSGLGDLVLTCSSTQSRNMTLGIALGKGKPLQAILAERHGVTEGVETAKAALLLAKSRKIEMPVLHAVHDILHKGVDIDSTIAQLLGRPLKQE